MGDRWQVIFTKYTHSIDYLKTQEGRNLPVMHCLRGSDGWQFPAELQDCLLYTSFGLSMTDQMQFIGDHIDSFSFVRVRPDSRKIYHKYNRNPSVNQSSTSITWDFPELSTVL